MLNFWDVMCQLLVGPRTPDGLKQQTSWEFFNALQDKGPSGFPATPPPTVKLEGIDSLRRRKFFFACVLFFFLDPFYLVILLLFLSVQPFITLRCLSFPNKSSPADPDGYLLLQLFLSQMAAVDIE